MKDKNPELETKNTLLASQLEAAQREIQRLTLPANQKQYKDRPEVEDRILQIVAASEPIIDTELEKQLGIGHQLAKHHVGELSRADMIDTEATFDNHSHWELTDQGRAYLAERDLLK
jgi:predicted ArsR family transcriptional regulator